MKIRMKILSAIMAVTMGLFIGGCGKETALQEPEPQKTESQNTKTQNTENKNTETQETEIWIPETQVAEFRAEDLTTEQQNMLAVMDSLNMCMVENEWEYEPENPDFFWSALTYTIGNYSNLRDNETSGLITIEDGVMKVYYRLVQEYATGLFEDYSDLLEIPAGNTMVALDADNEYYDFNMGDRGLSYGKIVSWVDNGDGTSTVETQLLGAEDDSVIADYIYTLVANPYADGIEDPLFVYTIRSVEKVQ